MKLLRNPLTVAALAVLALGVVVWNLARPLWTRYQTRAKAAPAAARKATRVTPAIPQVRPDAPAATSLTPINLEVIQARLVEWIDSPLRDPFEAYLGGLRGTPGPRAADLLALKAVWRQTGQRLAVINDAVVGEGDQVLGFRIDRIEGDVVWVHGTNGTERLQFPDPAGYGPGSPNPAKRNTPRKRAST